VEIARAAFEDSIDIAVENLPPGVTASRLTISKGQTTGNVLLRSAGNSIPSTTSIKVVASAKAGQKLLTSETTVTLMVVAPSAPQADVFFVLDVTGSMEWAINGVRDGIGSFAAKMRENKIDFRIGLLAFRDLTYDPVPMDLLQFGDGQPFTNDVTEFRSQVRRLESKGGGDDPESSLEAVENACQQPFRKGATKVLLLITDAPPKVTKVQEEKGTTIGKPKPGQVEDAVKRTAGVVRAKDIDALHIVVRPRDQEIYEPLREAGANKGGGQYFNLEQVAAGTGFTDLIRSFTSSVVAATAAKNPDKPTVAADAPPSPSIKGVQSSQEFSKENQGQLVLAIGMWTGAISALVCLVLLSGQHHYLRGSLPAVSGVVAGVIGGMVVGIVGGAAGQGLYLLAPKNAFLAAIFQVFGWSILGGLAGAGLSLFIPNLKWVLGLAGGGIGGATGALGYMAVHSLAGDLVGRLVGGLILGFCIGLMVAIVEAAFRRAWLEVRYGARETITVNLGPEPVKIGGDNRMCTVWARGAAPVALRYFIRSGQVVCEDTPNRKEEVVRNGDAREVGNVTVTVRTGSSKSAGTASSRKPTAAPPPPRKAAPAQAELKMLDLGPIDDDPLPIPLDSIDDDPLPMPMSPATSRPSPAPITGDAPSVPQAARSVPAARPPVPTASKPPTPPAPPPRPAASPPAPAASPPRAAPSPSVASPLSPKPPPSPRDPEACPTCGRKNPGRPGGRYCMLCDQTY
jgi:hypothetical protein